MNLPYSVYLPQVSPAYRKDTAPLFNNDKLQILNCFVSTTYDGLYHLCFDYRNSSGRIFTSMVTLPYGQELANLKLTDQHGNELNISGESLYAVFANSYDFAASSSEYFGNPAATSVKPAIAFTIRHSSIKGGGPITVYRYINWLAELGFKVSVYSDDDPPDWVELKATFYKIVHDNGRYGAITEPIVVVYSLLELPQVLRYCHTRGKRIFHLCQGLEEFHVTRPPAGELPQAAPIFQILNSLPVGRIVVSPHLQLYFEDRYRQRCFPIFNGIDLGAFSPGEKPARPAGRYHILITGDPQHPLKGIPVVREAVALLARKHPGRQLVLTSISGQDVPEKSDATGFTSRLQSRLEPEEMCREYRDADVYVNASWYEGFGLPSLEAMACGTPVVQVANHGLEGIIEDGRNCLLVAEQDAATIAEALERLLTDHDLRQRIIAGGMATAAGYALPHQYGMLVAEFQKITGRQPDACLTNKKMKELEAAMDHYPKESAENSGLLFSILVPSYNQANFLPATLDSILAQDYPNWEALVVNDGSTDGTAAVMERYSSLDPRIRTFHQENGGVASALNVGLQHARGQWICWLSSDDLFEPGKLSLHLETIRNHPDVRFMHTNYSLLYDQTGEKVPVERNGEGLNDPARQLAAFLEANQVNGISIAIHRQVFDLVGHFDERLRNGQDFDMWLRIVSHYQPLYLNERTVVTRIHPAQGTSLSVEAGIYDSGRSCLDFLNNHPFPALFPKADLGDTSQSLQAVQFTLHILANPGSLINLCGYGPALLERMYEWLTSAGEQLQAQLEAHLPGIVESFQQDFYPEEIRQAFQRLPSSFGQSFSYKKHDPIQDLERKAECLDREQKIAEASALRKYLAKATGRDTSFATNVPFWQKLQEDGYFENHPLYGKEHNGLKLFGDDDAFVQQFLPLKREMKVVVIGCGYGRESALLARHVKHVYGIDVSRTLLDKTERFMKEQGIDNFTAVLAEEWEKVIPQGIDLVYSIVVFQHLTKDLVRNYVNGLAKKMAPGGRFLCQFCDAAGGSDDAHLAAYEPNVRWSMGEIEELIHNSGLDKVTIDDQEVAEGVRWYWAFFGDTSNASSALDRPVEGEQQESPAAAYAAAVSLADAGKPSEASAVLERLVSLHPEFALAHNGLGVLCCNGGQMDKALFHHEQAARLEPGNATFRKNLADFYQVVLGRTEEALQIYVKLLAVQPKDLEVLTALGKLCITQDKLDDAEYFFTRALEIEPWNMDIRQSLEALRNFENQPEKVAAGISAEELYRKAQGLAREGLPVEAMTALQELVRAYPDFALAHNDLGVLYSNTGEMEKALAHYEEAARLEPANVNIQKNLADLYHIVMGRTEEALQIYVKLLAVQPKDLEVLSALANLCLSLDRLDDAGYFFTRALEVEPWNAEIRQSLQALEAFSPSQPAPSAVTAESGSTGKECPAAGLAPEILALYGKKQQVLENAQIQPIDIIFLTYNRRDYFEKTIKALIERTRYPYRIIVVDNHSREDFRQYLQDTAILYDHVVLNDDNYFTMAFQRGIELAKSDPYVVSDPDILVPDLEGKCWLERMLDLHREYPEMGLIGLTLDPSNKPASLPDVILGEKIVYNDKITLANVGTWMQVIKRKYFDGKYTTDWEACEQVRKNGGKVGYAREFIAYHLGYDEERDHPDHLVEKYHLFKDKFGSDLYSMYTDSEEILARMGEKPAAYYGFSRPEVQELVNTTAKRILDVGCAAGAMGSELKARLQAEVWGIECLPEAAELAAKKLDKVLTGTVEEKLAEVPDGYFDTIIFADVLEHLREPAATLIAARAKLAAGGEIVASIPNVRHWSVVKELLEGKWDYRNEGILDRTHLRFFTRKGVMELFEQAGYKSTTMSATMLNDVQIPCGIPKALADAGLDVSTLAEESRHYQYLLRAVPMQAQQAKPVQNALPPEKKPVVPVRTAVTEPLTSIIILTFNQLQFTQECVESIQRHTPEPHEIVFVDNGSHDGTVKWLRQQAKAHNNYRLIENKKNLGFAKGCNQGMAAAKGEYLLLLNNDVVVTGGWLAGMLACINASADYGIVGPMTNNIAGPQQLATVPYGNMEEMQAFAAHFRAGHGHRRLPVKLVVGFCMLFRRALMDTIGTLDETFAIGNFEDDDLCLRASLGGLQSVIAGDVFIHHHGNKTFEGNKIDFGAAMAANRKIFDRKWDMTKMDKGEAFRLASHNALIKGEESFHKGDLDQAVKVLIEEGIKFAPADRRPYRLLTSFLIEAKRFADALAIIREMPGHGRDAESLVMEGVCREGLEQLAEAEGCVDNALALESSFAPALNLKGVLAFRAGDRSRAEELFTSAMAADPGFGEACTNLGVMRWSAQAHGEALELLEKGFMLNPTVSDAMDRYHSAISASEQFGRGEAAFREARVIFPHSRLITFKLIDLLLNQQKFEEAMAEIEQAMVGFGADDGIIDAALHVRKTLDGQKERPRAGEPGSISLCMIAKDEAPHLARALASVKPVVSEMIVVDTGSTDRTKDIARAFGASVFDLPWPGSFALARNESLAKASGTWILVMDADEVISCQDHGLLRQLTSGMPAGYTVCQKNYTCLAGSKGFLSHDGRYPEEEAGIGFQPNFIVRIFPNDSRIRFENTVHELVEPSLERAGLPVKEADLSIHHYGKLDKEKLRSKWEFYYQLGKKKLAEHPKDVQALTELAIQAAELGKHDEALELWGQVVEQEPDSANAHFNMGHAYLCQGRYGEALCSSKRAAALDPHGKEAVFNYGCCELYAGEIASVAALLENLLVNHPDYPPAIALLASIHFCLGEQDKGRQRLQQVREMNYDCGDFLFQHAKVLYTQGRFDWSRRLLEAAIDNGAVTAEITHLLTECTQRAA